MVKPCASLFVIACLLILPRAAVGGDIGIPSGPTEVPSETLPLNQALRNLEAAEQEQVRQKQVEYIRSQKGSAYFAYVPMGAIDRYGQPVADPQTHRQIADGFCIIWRPHWVLDNPDQARTAYTWFTSLSYRVDPRTGTLDVYQVGVPDGISTPSGFQRSPGVAIVRTSEVARLYDQPDPAWPCATETWVTVLRADERQYGGGGGGGVAGGGFPGDDMKRYRQKQHEICIANPQTGGRC